MLKFPIIYNYIFSYIYIIIYIIVYIIIYIIVYIIIYIIIYIVIYIYISEIYPCVLIKAHTTPGFNPFNMEYGIKPFFVIPPWQPDYFPNSSDVQGCKSRDSGVYCL